MYYIIERLHPEKKFSRYNQIIFVFAVLNNKSGKKMKKLTKSSGFPYNAVFLQGPN